jgi:hypothetical protein
MCALFAKLPGISRSRSRTARSPQAGTIGGKARAFGIETEYGITVSGVQSVDFVFESTELVRCYADHGFIGDSDSDLRLSNGARFYSNHHYPKYSTPECSTLREIVAQDKAGERILSECVRRRNKEIGPHRQVRLYKKHTDFTRHTYDCHDNYLMSRSVPWDRLTSDVLPFLVTRQIFAGAGKMGIEGQGSSSQPGVYQISQRSDFFSVPVSIDTLNLLPIVAVRDEPYADPGKYRRFQVIVGDANMSEFAVALKVGTMALVLELIENREAPQLEIAQPVDALKSISRDQSQSWIIALKDGRKISAIDIQRMYLEKAQKHCDRSYDEVSWVLEQWERILNDLEVDYMRCVDRIDWVAKKFLLNTFQESEKLDWTDPWLQSIDLEYHNIAWEQGLYYELVRENQIRCILKEDEIKTAIFMPPETTRAYFRGRSVARFKSQIHAIAWEEVVFNQNSGRRRVAFNHASNDARIDALNAMIDEATDYNDFCKRLESLDL